MRKSLKTYIEKLQDRGLICENQIPKDLLNAEIESVTYDNRKIQGNSIFICKGQNFKSEYAISAFDSGAICYVADKKIEGLNNAIIVNDIRGAITCLAKTHFNNPQDNLKILGLTGTKGKGSTAFILQSIIDNYQLSINKNKCAILSGIQTYDGKNTYVPNLTTPETLELFENFYNATCTNIDTLIMEVSSQALKYRRVEGVNYEVACFTNFGKDHISDIEHPTIDDYFHSKLKIFDRAKTAVINSSSLRFDEIKEYAADRCQIITFGKQSGDDIYCSDIELFGDHSNFKIKTKDFELNATLNIGGIHNIENALCAVAVAYSLQIPAENIKSGLVNASIPGRMKFVKSADGKKVAIVDFAHNEMSFETLFSSVKKEYPGYYIVAIFGAPGNKAYNRRVELPNIASKYADYIIITEDDPYIEGFKEISKTLVENIIDTDYKLIEDRSEAIKYAIANIFSDKTVYVIAGKGEETFQKKEEGRAHYEGDLNIVKEIL